MSRRAGRRSYCRRVAVGGNPLRNVGAAMLGVPARPGEVWSVALAHDDGCPSLSGGGIPACTCELVELRAERVA